MDDTLQLFNPEQHLYERWPARMWTKCAVTGDDATGAKQCIAFWVEWSAALAYVLPVLDAEHIPSPMPGIADFVAAASAACASGAAGLIGGRLELFDGYYYNPAMHVRRTYQQDLVEASAQHPMVTALISNRPAALAAGAGEAVN